MNALPYIITVKNRVEKVNKPYLDLTGYTKEQLLGRTVGDVLQQLL
ncbi:MAG: PAS domain S-box protein, partial [Gracilibacteraceae bacterium]|nr:PAS domain S-box protein [Gracilibacteraceae bacterium]